MLMVPIVIQFSCGQILIENALHSYGQPNSIPRGAVLAPFFLKCVIVWADFIIHIWNQCYVSLMLLLSVCGF